MDTKQVPQAADDLDEVRLLKAALEVSRRVEPAENARAIVAGASALTGGDGGFLYLRSQDGGEHRLLGSHAGTDDPRRKGLLRIDLEAAWPRRAIATPKWSRGPALRSSAASATRR